MTARPLRRGNWSVQEMERLRQLMPRRGVADTALLLRRTESSVFKKAMQLLRVPPRRGAWTASDDGRLRECWGAVDPRLLAPMLGRPLVEYGSACRSCVRALGKGPWTREEVHALRDFYGTRSDDDLEVALAQSRADVAAMAQSLCLAKDKRFAAQSARQVVAAGEGARRQEMPRWTPAQVERLQALYPDRDNLTVARELGRSVASVANKANQLGLRKCPQLLALIGRANVALRYREADATGG